MSDKSEIQWTDATWNTVYGCTKVSPACAHCYIERAPPYRMQGLKFERGEIPVQLLPERLDVPFRWKRPRMIFVNSLADTFHEDVPDSFILQLWRVMAATSRHTYQVLTKRPDRMRSLLSREQVDGSRASLEIAALSPLANVWLGTTVENQRWADERIPLLLDTPAAVRFVSIEPLLGPIDLTGNNFEDNSRCYLNEPLHGEGGLDWVIVGGESAGPVGRRLVTGPHDIVGHPRYLPSVQGHEWVASLRDQCGASALPFFFKQWGGPTPKSGGRLLDGREWDEMPGRAVLA
ncbi:MAG: Phage protein [Anaerolineales bacterium]|nr:Phage protein [Anaerolineales bacterium]